MAMCVITKIEAECLEYKKLLGCKKPYGNTDTIVFLFYSLSPNVPVCA